MSARTLLDHAARATLEATFSNRGAVERPHYVALLQSIMAIMGAKPAFTETTHARSEISMGLRLSRFLYRASGYWSLKDNPWAAVLGFSVLIFTAAQLGSQVFWNLWNRWFFDSLDHKDVGQVWAVVMLIPLILSVNLISSTGLLVGRLILQIKWREWLTKSILGWWIADQRYYRLPFVAKEQSVPESRISDDIRLAIEPLVDFGLGLLTAFFTAATFATILWQVGGSAHFFILGGTFEIPAYLAVAAIIYATVVTSVAAATGRPLVARIGAKNEAEACFRAEMTRLRENAESIALIRGDDDERASVTDRYGQVVAAWFLMVKQNAVASVVLNMNASLFPIVPLLLVAPKFLSGELTLGAVMQVTTAFIAVQGALIWFVDNLLNVANWLASVSRVVALVDALESIDVGTRMDDINKISIGMSDDGAVHLNDLAAAHRNGRIMIASSNITIDQGERVLIAGESGTGKSTLIRAIAGLWPWGSGSILLPQDASVAFVPQRPYLPLGTLRNAICYPSGDTAASIDEVANALKRCGLGYLMKRLDEVANWDHELSGGERQRVAFARIFVQKPSIIIMDEATSALDEDSQSSLLQQVCDELSGSTLISVGHRPSLEAYHNRKITLTRKLAGAELMTSQIGKFSWLQCSNRVISGSNKSYIASFTCLAVGAAGSRTRRASNMHASGSFKRAPMI